MRFHKKNQLIVIELGEVAWCLGKKIHTFEKATNMLSKSVPITKFKHFLDLVSASLYQKEKLPHLLVQRWRHKNLIVPK